MEVRQEILQGSVCSGWLMRFLRCCSQKLWEGDGTSEPVSDIKTRSPHTAHRDHLFSPQLGCGCLCHPGDPIPTLMSPAEVGQELQGGRLELPMAMPSPAQGAEQKPPNPHPALATAGLWVTRGSDQPPKRLLRLCRAAHSFLPRDRVGASPPHLPQLASVAGSGEEQHSSQETQPALSIMALG